MGFDFRRYAQASLKRRIYRRLRAEGLDSLSQLQDRLLRDPSCMERLAPRPLDQRDVDVPRSVVLRHVPGEGRADAAHVPVHAYLVRRLLHGRGGLLARDPPSGGRAVRADPHLRDRHQRTRAREGARGRLSARQDEAVHAELHSRRRNTRILRVLRRRVRQRPLLPDAHRERRLRATQPRDGHELQRIQRHPLPQRDDLLRQAAAGTTCTSCSTEASRGSASSRSGTKNRSASRGTRTATRKSMLEERIYRKFA